MKFMVGYAFIDTWGYCIIIVYGEKRRDSLINFLNGRKRNV